MTGRNRWSASCVREKGIRAFLVEDVGGDYIPVRKWENTAEQRALSVSYPADNLRVVALPTREDRDSQTRAELRAAVDILSDAQSPYASGLAPGARSGTADARRPIASFCWPEEGA